MCSDFCSCSQNGCYWLYWLLKNHKWFQNGSSCNTREFQHFFGFSHSSIWFFIITEVGSLSENSEILSCSKNYFIIVPKIVPSFFSRLVNEGTLSAMKYFQSSLGWWCYCEELDIIFFFVFQAYGDLMKAFLERNKVKYLFMFFLRLFCSWSYFRDSA